MPDFRAYCPTSDAAPAELRLSPEESHHLVVVNRCGRGDPQSSDVAERHRGANRRARQGCGQHQAGEKPGASARNNICHS